jgi:ribose 5-phosphate isomerase
MPEEASESTERVREKQQAADRAVAYVESGMVVGLGAGTTAILATRRIGQLLREGRLGDIDNQAIKYWQAYSLARNDWHATKCSLAHTTRWRRGPSCVPTTSASPGCI